MSFDHCDNFHMGMYLLQSVFSHGQLYVALSCVGIKEQAIICVVEDGRDGTYAPKYCVPRLFGRGN